MKAQFMEQQSQVRWQPLDGGLVDVTICLNGEETTKYFMLLNGTHSTKTYWQYDFNQFREKEANLNKETIEANPEEYLTYTPKEETLETLEERIKVLEETIKTLTETTT